MFNYIGYPTSIVPNDQNWSPNQNGLLILSNNINYSIDIYDNDLNILNRTPSRSDFWINGYNDSKTFIFGYENGLNTLFAYDWYLKSLHQIQTDTFQPLQIIGSYLICNNKLNFKEKAIFDNENLSLLCSGQWRFLARLSYKDLIIGVTDENTKVYNQGMIAISTKSGEVKWIFSNEVLKKIIGISIEKRIKIESIYGIVQNSLLVGVSTASDSIMLLNISIETGDVLYFKNISKLGVALQGWKHDLSQNKLYGLGRNFVEINSLDGSVNQINPIKNIVIENNENTPEAIILNENITISIAKNGYIFGFASTLRKNRQSNTPNALVLIDPILLKVIWYYEFTQFDSDFSTRGALTGNINLVYDRLYVRDTNENLHVFSEKRI